MIIYVRQKIGLKLFFISWITFIFEFFFSGVDMFSEYIKGINDGLNIISQDDSVSFLLGSMIPKFLCHLSIELA